MSKNFTNIDIHAHLNFKDFSDDRDETIARAHKKGVAMINIGTNINTSTEVVRLADGYDEGVYAIVGLHPISVTPENPDFNMKRFEDLLDSPKVVGIGECGLDYFHLEADVVGQKARQEKAFRQQIELAIEHDLPIMIHCRDAYPEVIDILKEYKNGQNEIMGEAGAKLRGNIHFFAGSVAQAQEFLDLDFTISFTGVITFAKQYEELVKFVPLDKMHAETDCPYVAPAGNRGKRNESSFVLEVVEKIAEIKGLSVGEVSSQLMDNASRLFGVL